MLLRNVRSHLIRLPVRLLASLYAVCLVPILSTPSAIGQSRALTHEPPLLTATLQSLGAVQLAQQAATDGDAARGAVIFFQRSLACANCHSIGREGTAPSIGPDLSNYGTDRRSDVELVEALLSPSKSIREGYASIVLRTSDDEVLTGIPVPGTSESRSLRTASGQLLTIPNAEIVDVKASTLSLMPEGQMNLLSDRQQFLDLIKYLMEIRDGGSSRARELQPAESMLVLKVPEYEARLDHAGLIGDWSPESLERGQAIYQRVCANCHGTRDQLGSLPTSLRFAEGKFKNGSDPLAMYRTLTHGFGLMPAQSWMVPSQKYDVIHYIRETFMAHNPNVATHDLPDAYLASLPRGDTRGPAPSQIEAWSAMDYGNHLAHCYEIPDGPLNIAYKGIAMRLDPGPGGVARGNQWMIFDTDTMRWAAGWTMDPEQPQERFIDWRDIQFNGEHGVHPRIVGKTIFTNAVGPGWSHPTDGSWTDDRRVQGRDRRRYGPLPKDWAQFHGTFAHGARTIVSYSIGDTKILESPTLWTDPTSGDPILVRILNIEPHASKLALRIADLTQDDSTLVSLRALRDAERPNRNASNGSFGSASVRLDQLTAGLIGPLDGLEWKRQQGQLRLELDPSTTPRQLAVWTAASDKAIDLDVVSLLDPNDLDLQSLVAGGPLRWSQTLASKVAVSHTTDEFTIETLESPEPNPWLAQMRFTGLDYFSDGSLAICSWDGDVWHVREQPSTGQLLWRRIASGLYQPLGIKIIKDVVHLTCRDQLAVLRDLNGDGETDWIQCLNNDHQVTEHFHEFAMGLQVDSEGYFYYAKSGRHALKAVVPQHGTLLRIAPDGSSTEILATGFRAANGVCLNPDGSFIVTDQEGFWNPKNRINWVTYDPASRPKFYGNMFGYHDVTDTSDTAMEPPLCWITNAFDRSPAELLWIDSPRWKELQGGLLNFSYGYGKIYLVLHEVVDGSRQGGMIELPIPSFPTGIMRGRMHPTDGSLLVCGMYSWAGSATAPGGLYRLRKSDAITTLPIAMHATEDGIELVFAQPLASNSVQSDRVQIEVWDLRRSERYGSDHLNQRALRVTGTKLSEDGTRVHIQAEGLAPTWGMQLTFDFQMQGGRAATGVIHNTIHQLAPSDGNR